MRTWRLLGWGSLAAVGTVLAIVLVPVALFLSRCAPDEENQRQAERELGRSAAAFGAAAAAPPGPAARSDVEFGVLAGMHSSKIRALSRGTASVTIAIEVEAAYSNGGTMPSVEYACYEVKLVSTAAGWQHSSTKVDRCPTEVWPSPTTS